MLCCFGSWASEARLSLMSLIFKILVYICVCVYVWQTSKRSVRVNPRKLLENVNISADARNSGENTSKYCQKKKKTAMETEED